ncbi:hypothetical protein BJY24_003322 [Nocardia transvalensis]|uniref:Uncharacterized protein n=1 Tax=Nocardia transvalensis TaxID=37333 RepID=A0A7W9PEK2_9NOCA|nr:hypothetical protein [Nocardia transvalensis]MBB5914455.1 hypothetical protein [Nocardia transvalensis]
MTDRTIDTVPEADFAEQTVPAYPDVEDDDTEADVPVGTDREATEADIIDQAIPVPIDDDYEAESEPEY